MDKILQSNINELLNQLQVTSYSKGKNWNGYEVYVPKYNETMYVGLPSVILVKDGVARISTPDECLEYLDYENSK